MKNIFRNIMRDVRVELLDEFDANFQRKAFFDRPWKESRHKNKRGSLLMRSGMLRRGNRAVISGNRIDFTNSQPYAAIHNEGGQLIVTEKMKKFFWAMYYKSGGAAAGATGQRKQMLTDEAKFWQAMALKKIGSSIKIEKRQFIGWHSALNPKIERIIDENMKEADAYLRNILNQGK